MSKYLFFLIIFLIPLPLAYAEVGKDFDTEQLPNGLTQWTSHYDRIFDGDSWENYLISNNPVQLEFESANLSFLFDKVSCDFKLLDPESETVAIDGYNFSLSIDGLPTVLPVCNLESFIQSGDKVSFTINRGLFKTLYEMNPTGSMEWTHDIDNNEGKASTFTIIETCTDCIANKVDGNQIDFGSYTLDTKNEVHNTVKETRSDKGDYIIEYEKTVNDEEKLIIDPTFTSNNPSEDAELVDNDADNTCEAVSGALAFNTASGQVGRFSTAEATADCGRFYSEWDITSIPDTVSIIDVDFTFDISGIVGTPANCDYVSMAAQPTITTDANNWANIGSGTTLVSSDTACKTAGDNKNVDLGAGGNSYVDSQLSSNWVAIGVKANGDVGALDGTYHIAAFSPEESASTPDPTLTIVYVEFVPDAVTDLTSTDIRPTSVDLDWTEPNLNGGTLSGYQINYTTPWSSSVNTILTGQNNTCNS